MLREMDTLRRVLDETAKGIDEYTHIVPDWEFWIGFLLEDLEFYAMANDPDHPSQYLNLLKRVRESINRRIELES